MAATFEICGQEGLNDFQNQTGICIFSAETQDIGIVVLASPLGCEDTVAQSRPYAPNFVGGYAHTYARVAY